MEDVIRPDATTGGPQRRPQTRQAATRKSLLQLVSDYVIINRIFMACNHNLKGCG